MNIKKRRKFRNSSLEIFKYKINHTILCVDKLLIEVSIYIFSIKISFIDYIWLYDYLG